MDIWNIVQMAFGGGVVAGIVEVCAMAAENGWGNCNFLTILL